MVRSSSLTALTNTAINREIASEYDNVRLVADNIEDVSKVAEVLNDPDVDLVAIGTAVQNLGVLQDAIDALEVVVDGKADTVHTHTGAQIIQDSTHRFVTDAEKAVWNAIDTNAELRDRSTHTGTQSLDTTTDSATRVAMSPAERTKLNGIQTGATSNDTNANLRDRSTHTGTQSIDTITETADKKVMTSAERSKLNGIELEANKYEHPTKHPVGIIEGGTNYNKVVRTDAVGTVGFGDVSWSEVVGKPTTYTPSEHVHTMDDITSGTLSATRVDTTTSRRFVTDDEKAIIADAETKASRGVPNGYAPLDANGKINASYLNDLNLVEVFTPANVVSMLQLASANPGDIAYVQDTEVTYMLIGLPSDQLSNWKPINTAAAVQSVNGKTGIVALSTSDISEGTNKYYTDERVDDRVNGLLQAGTNVSLTYDDVANTLVISANDTSVNWNEIQNVPTTVAGYGISDVYTETEINEVVAAIDNTLVMHANAIVDNTSNIIALAKSNATGAFGASGLTLNMTGTQQTVPFTVVQQSTNVDKFELTANNITIKATGNYTFLSTVTFEDAGANGAVGTVTFRVRDAGAVYHTQTTTIEISGNDRDTVPFNSLLVVPSGVPLTAYITVTCNISGYRIVGFESVLTSEKATGELSGLASHTAVTPSGNIASINVQGALEELDNEKLSMVIANASHIGRADKYLAAQAVANMVYTDGKLSKVQYNNATDVDYEVLTYSVAGKLDNVAHYVSSTLAGNTSLSYAGGKLVSAIYTGV